MKQKLVLMAVACLLISAVAAFAQTKTDFSGEWTLDVSKSKAPNIESGTMSVTQTDKDITLKADFKRTPRPEGAGAGGGGGQGGGAGQGGGMGQGGGGGRAMGGAAPQAMTYALDGKETSVDMPGAQGTTTTAKLKSEWDGAKLKLTSKRTFNTPNGEMTVTSKETWEIVDGGKGLKVIRETESPRGNQTSEFYYAKK